MPGLCPDIHSAVRRTYEGEPRAATDCLRRVRRLCPDAGHRDADRRGDRHSNGCRLDEGSPHPCIVHGRDIGDTLYSMRLMFWFGMLTVPVGAIGLLISLIWLAKIIVSRR